MDGGESSGGRSSSSPSSRLGIVERTRAISGSPLARSGTGERRSNSSSDNSPPPPVEPRSNTPEIPARVFWKIVIFAILLVVLPIAVFFLGKNYVFSENTMMSFVASIATVNLILTVAVIFAYLEGDVEEGAVKIKNN